VIAGNEDDDLVECLEFVESGIFEGPDSQHVGDSSQLQEYDDIDLEEVILDNYQYHTYYHPSNQKYRVVHLTPFALTS